MSDPSPKKIKFDYIKANLFRTARADGAWAGTNGFADIILSFYSERTPIPKQLVFGLTDQHNIGEEFTQERVMRDAMVREVEICLSMSLDVAKSLKALLGKQIEAIEMGIEATKAVPKKEEILPREANEHPTSISETKHGYDPDIRDVPISRDV